MSVLLLLGVGVLIAFALFFWGHSAVKSVVRGDATLIALPLGTFLVLFFLFVVVKSACHECLTFPSIAICERRSGAIDVHLESNRTGGRIVERNAFGCTWVWHENPENPSNRRYGD